MLRCNKIGYSHKSGTGHHYKNQRCSVISSIPGCCPSNRNILVGTPLPPPIPPDTYSAMAVANQDHQPVVHMSLDSLRITVMNANSVQSTLISILMTDTNSNGGGVFSNS